MGRLAAFLRGQVDVTVVPPQSRTAPKVRPPLGVLWPSASDLYRVRHERNEGPYDDLSAAIFAGSLSQLAQDIQVGAQTTSSVTERTAETLVALADRAREPTAPSVIERQQSRLLERLNEMRKGTRQQNASAAQ